MCREWRLDAQQGRGANGMMKEVPGAGTDGKPLQAERIASAKALGQECAGTRQGQWG